MAIENQADKTESVKTREVDHLQNVSADLLSRPQDRSSNNRNSDTASSHLPKASTDKDSITFGATSAATKTDSTWDTVTKTAESVSKAANDYVIKPANDYVVKPTVKAADDYVVKPAAKAADDYVVKPTQKVVKTFKDYYNQVP